MGASIMDDLPPGFALVPDDSQPRMFGRKRPVQPIPIAIPPGAQPHDGDTLPLGGPNGRVFGVDAFELGQPGYIGGKPVDLGAQGRSYLTSQLTGGGTATTTGAATYGRPVVTLDTGGKDYGRSLLDQGLGVAEPNYLRSDPTRFAPYMEAERAARLNRRGAFAGQFQMPSDYRHKEPWAPAQASTDNKGDAVFWDEPAPFQGLRPDIAKAYIALGQDPKTTAADLLAFGKSNGFEVGDKNAVNFIAARAAGAKVGSELNYLPAPKVLTDAGDGATGAAARGLGDPVNMLDEMGGVVDSLGGTPGRESVWNSDRRFGDILYNNIDQNRSILGYDDEKHPYARFGGQIASGFVAPGMSVEGIGLNAGRAALRNGLPIALAREAAKKAVRNRLMLSGGIEGGLAGFGSGEDSLTDRYKNALIGTGIGALAAPVIGAGADRLGAGIKAARQRFTNRGSVADDLATQAAEQTASAEVDNNLGPANIAPRAVPEPQAATDNWVTRDAEGRQRYQRSIGSLWQMSHDELDSLHLRAIEKERQDLRAAVQQSGITVSPRLLSRIENGDTEAAGRSLADEIEKQTGADLSPDLQKLLTPIWADHPEGGLPNASDIADVKKAHGVGFDDDPHMLASEVGWAMRDLKPGDLEAVNRGEGSITAQGAVVSMRGAFDALRAKGVTSAEMPAIVRDAMVKNGVHPSTADELTGLVFEMMRPAADRGSRVAIPSPMSMPHDIPPGFTLEGPALPVDRPRDRIDISAPDLPPGFDWEHPMAGTLRPVGRRASAEEIAATARTVNAGDVLPIPRNEVDSLDEAMRIGEGMRPAVPAPNERDALPPFTLAGQSRPRRNPLDLAAWLRTRGGVQDQGGDLASMGIGNRPRDIPLAGDVGLPRLVNPSGMPLDDAARAAWEAGYFPHSSERPTISEFLDALDATHRGGPGRVFHPDDYATVDNYHATIAQRNAIEQAEASGNPVHHDLGRPIVMDDLDANQPPATAYEDLPRVGGKAGNIALDRLATPQDIQRALINVDAKVGGFDAARRGKMAHGETAALAREMGMTADDLLKRRQGQALNAEQALAARSILAKSGNELVGLARKAQGGSDADLAAFRQAWVRHVAIQEQVSGATAEAGRTLSSFRMTADSRDAAAGRIHKAIIDGAGGRDKLEDIAQKVIDLEADPAKANKFARDVMKPGAWAMAKEYWINALLSGPRTHATNIGSNLLTALWSVPEHAMTATIGKATRSADAMTYRDVGARAVGMIEGAKDGLRLARKAFMSGEPTDGVSQVEAQNYRAIPGKLGAVIRTPTRALTAEDEFFKSIAYRGELNALAARAAYRQGGTAAERQQLFQQLRDNPTESMMADAVKAAQYQTFQAPLKGPGVQIQMLANKGPMKLFLPFVRTPLNLLKYATERSPLAPVLSEFRDAVSKGGMARDQAIARVTMGSGLAALAVSWAMDGKLSGSGPVDPREREALRNTGWQPFSVKVGDKWYSYQRIDPFARVLSTAADFATFDDYMTDEERENLAKYLSLAVARNISTMPTLDPAASAFEALSDPDRYLTRYATNLAASAAVPNFVTQINSTLDPYMRETDGLLDTVKSRVPVLSNGLPARLNIWGQPTERGDALGPDLLSPIYSSRMNGDKSLAEIARLRLGLSKPPRKIGDARLTTKQYSDLVTYSGQPAKQMIDGLTADPQWDKLPDGMRRLLIKNAVETSRKSAREQMLMQYPDLAQAQAVAAVKRKTGERTISASDLPPGFVLEP